MHDGTVSPVVNTVALRPYQEQALVAIEAALQTRQRTLLVLATGLGKTVCFMEFARRRRHLGRTLIIAHRKELLDQAGAKAAAAGLSWELETGEHRAMTYGFTLPDVVCATVQSLKGARLERWKPHDFATVITDECFPAGVMIGDVPIEDVVVGDVVDSVDHHTQTFCRRRVVRLFRKETPLPLVRITHGARELTCTRNHPVFVKGRGYVQAENIKVGDLLYVSADIRLSSLRLREDAEDLQQRRVPPKTVIADNGGHESRSRVEEDDRKKPDKARSGSRTGEPVTPIDGSWSKDSWRQWPASDASGSGHLGGARMADAGGGTHENAARLGLSELLQARCGERGAEDRRGSRWPKPQRACAPSSGQEEGRVFAWSRVDRVESVEPASAAGTTVYNFEVEGSHTYFANGVLVHNCHHAVASSYRTVLDRFALAKQLFVTATPDRGDGVGMVDVVDNIAFDYQLRQGILDGWLSPLKMQTIHAPSVDMASVRSTKQEHGRDYNPTDLAKQMESQESLHAMAKPIIELATTRQTIIFTPSVEIAHLLATVMSSYVGRDRVAALDGGSDQQLRARTLSMYRAGQVQFLVNCALFTEGFDAPATACIAVARPTKSRALYAQMIGRGTRGGFRAPVAGKDDCLVLDLEPRNAKHELMSPLDLIGKTFTEAEKKEVRALALSGMDLEAAMKAADDRAKERAERAAEAKRKAHLRATKVDYKVVSRDPFGVRRNGADDRGPLTPASLRAELLRWRMDPQDVPNRLGPAMALKQELIKRKRAGLASFGQAKQLAKRGLRTDITFAEASAVMDELVRNQWRITPELREKYGAK